MRLRPFLTTLAALLLVAGPAVGQEEEDPDNPSGFVGSAPGSEGPPEEDESDDEDAEDEEADDGEEASADKKEESDDQDAEDEGADDGDEADDEKAETDETDTGRADKPVEHASTRNSFVVAPHAGLSFPPFDNLGLWGTFGLEVGVMPGFEERDDRPLEVALVGRYTEPSATATNTDANLGQNGGSYTWTMTHQTVSIDGIVLWRFREEGQQVVPYALGGVRMNMTRTSLSAQADNGADFGSYSESNLHVGGVAGGGVDVALGPGTLFGELTFGGSQLNQNLTDLSSTSAVALDVGYRFYPF